MPIDPRRLMTFKELGVAVTTRKALVPAQAEGSPSIVADVIVNVTLPFSPQEWMSQYQLNGTHYMGGQGFWQDAVQAILDDTMRESGSISAEDLHVFLDILAENAQLDAVLPLDDIHFGLLASQWKRGLLSPYEKLRLLAVALQPDLEPIESIH